jgi:isoquinoline 1-oxidoreductase subunit beta
MSKDPVQFRLSLLEGREPFLFGNPQDKNTISPKRLAGVLRAATEKIGWGKPLPKDVYQGVACLPYSDTNAYVAHAIQIRMTGEKQFKIEKAVAAVDSGRIIEPEGYYNQIEGGFAFGLSSALKSEITVERGRVMQSNFRDYEILNFEEMPPLEVVVIPSQEPPGGGGEVGVPTVAAALCNALAAAGERPRRLPIRKEGFTWT